jgi:DNA-binding MarR family transcriptional regulator
MSPGNERNDVPSAARRFATVLCKMRTLHAPGSPAAKAGITPALAFTLGWIADNNGASVSEIARGCGTTKPTVTVAVNRLEERGLVERLPNPADRRGVAITVTAEGRTLARSIERYRLRKMKKLLESLTRNEQITLVELLEKAVEKVRL